MFKKIAHLLSQAWYWLRTHTVHRYHVVDCRAKQNGYAWGWIDRSELIWYACFNILVDFVRNEMPYGHTDWYGEGRVEVKKEIDELAYWWLTGRAEEHKLHGFNASQMSWDLPEAFNDKSPERLAVYAEIERLEAKDDEMLLRLIKIRGYLWT